MRFLAAILASLAVAAPAGASEKEAPTPAAADYAVLSLLGDRLLVAGALTSVGSVNSRHEFIDLGDSLIEGRALVAVKEAIAKLEPGAAVVLLRSRNAALFAIQEETLGASGGGQALADALRPQLESLAAKRLLLVSKLRRSPILHFASRYYERDGRIEGLGYYVDRGLHVKNPETGVPQSGFIAFFAYFRMSLIDTRTWRVLREVDIAESRLHGERDKDPWEAFSAEQKVAALQALLRDEMMRGVPRLLIP
jgi:hypothetical protein